MNKFIDVNIAKSFNSKLRTVNLSFNLEISLGEITGLYGPSGIGKSSLLKMVSGLEKPDSGNISYNDKEWFSESKKVNISPKNRSIAFVFQDYNLFPNMSVYENLKYASPNGEVNPWILKLANQLGVTEYLKNFPNELSGGQKQRAAILRAFAQEARTILMDEPFSSLDDTITGQLTDVIKSLVDEKQLTIIIASHRKEMLQNLVQEVILFENNGNLTKANPKNTWQ